MSNNMKKYVTYWMVAMLFVPISVLAANFTREDNCKELYRIYDYECEMNENYHETDFSMAAQRILVIWADSSIGITSIGSVSTMGNLHF